MKKLLLTTAACGLVLSAAPASAEGVELNLGGYFKGYGAFVDQDETAGNDVNDFDMIRSTEIHFGGETTLDNGLTVGAHFETKADGGDALGVDESYVYFSGGWGRVNVGAEDGAGYLLQVAAPSADSNIDGIRQYVQPVNYTVLGVSELAAANAVDAGLDYDMDVTGTTDKVTYLSPIMNGFQVGATFVPDATDAAADHDGVGVDTGANNSLGQGYEAAVRYEGEFNNVGVTAGAGYAFVENENETAGNDDREAWNVGVDLEVGAFGVGVIYTEDNGAQDDDEEETFVVGVDYTTGAFKLGASYLTQDNTYAVKDLDTDRYSAGVTYTYGPGMTFRGSVGYIEHDNAANTDADATYVTLGTQINF